MAELCNFYWYVCKTIFSKTSCGSQDIIHNIPLDSKQMTDYCFRRVKTISQEVCFWRNGRCLKFFWQLSLTEKNGTGKNGPWEKKSPEKWSSGKTVHGKNGPRKIGAWKNGPQKIGPRKNVLQKLFPVKKIPRNLNDFFIFIDWFHYHTKRCLTFTSRSYMHQTAEH